MKLVPLAEQFARFAKYFKEKKEKESIGLNHSGNNERLTGVELQAEVVSEEININREHGYLCRSILRSNNDKKYRTYYAAK